MGETDRLWEEGKDKKWDERQARWEERHARREARAARRGSCHWASSRRAHHGGSQGMVAGGIIVAVGLILLLDNMGVIHAHDFWRYWPLAVVAVGLGRIFENHHPAGLVWGGLIALVGTLFILHSFNLIAFSFNLIWPLMVIAFGLSMLMRTLQRARAQPAEGVEPGAVPETPNDPSFLHMWTVFGGSRRRVNTPDFRGGDVFALFGGFHIDLRGAKIERDNVILDINAMFGGVELIVPETWLVTVRGVGIFGGFEDKTLPPRPVEGAKAPHLTVTGTAMFGGVGVRN